MNKAIVTVAIFCLALAACTKKRDDTFAQGQGGEGLLSIENYDNKFFKLRTGSAIGDLYTSKSEKVVIETEKSKVVNNFPIVNYTTEAKLLDNVPFRGREKSDKYEVLYKLNETHLVVYKVAAEEDIPMQERPTAIKIEDKRLAVPMIGYPIKSFVRIEKQKNSDGESTNTLLEINSEGKSQATHFRIDLNLGELYKQVQKIDIFPTALLDGEWYYSETVISVPEKKAAEIGYTMSFDTEFHESTKIKFVKFDSAITGVNTNVDERIKNDKDGVNSNNVVTIPVEWKAYKTVKRGDSIQMSEEEDPNIPWDRRPFMAMQLEKITSTGTVNLNMKVMDLKIADDYFSFSVFDTIQKTKTRYSFARVKETNYKPRGYSVADSRVFGFFTSSKNHLKSVDDYSQEDMDQYLRLARFDPEKPIIFHFTKTTPDWIRPACIQVVKNWQDAFRKAGVNIEVSVDDKNDVDLGDIRYNAINMIETVTSSDLFGVGPSLIEPASGQIISAITNVHMTSIIDQVIEEIRTYVNRETGAYKGLWISGVKIPGFESLIQTADDKRFPQLGYFENEIKNKCPQVVDYVNSINVNAKRESAKDMAVFRPCAKKLAVEKIQSTLVHEMGHNFGLRHNFRASTDAVNFWPKEVTKTSDSVESSSVMEYPDFTSDRLIMPGPYDIAAIRYGYANQVEIRNGDNVKLVDVDPFKSLRTQNLFSQLKPYKYCTDEDTPDLEDYRRKVDPLCNRHDKGVTADKVVDFLIDGYQRILLRYNFRMKRDQDIDSSRLVEYKDKNFFKPMMFIYFKWRDYLAQYVGENRKYLSGFDIDQYQLLLEKMSKDKYYGPIYAEYKPAADKIVNFFVKLMSVQPKYCIARDSSQNVKYFDLTQIRDEIFRDKEVTVNSCFDSEVLAYLQARNLTVEFGGGFFNQDIHFDMSDVGQRDIVDVYGLAEDKRLAMDKLMTREALSKIMIEKAFMPMPLEEPQYRKMLVEYVQDRIFNGYTLKDFGIDDNRRMMKFGYDLAGGQALKRENLLPRKFMIIKNSFDNPEDAISSAMNSEMFNIDNLTGGETTSEDDLIINIGTRKLRAKKANEYAYRMLEKVKYLFELQSKPIEEINKAGYDSVEDVKEHLNIFLDISGQK